jgi:hypothetical protein
LLVRIGKKVSIDNEAAELLAIAESAHRLLNGHELVELAGQRERQVEAARKGERIRARSEHKLLEHKVRKGQHTRVEECERRKGQAEREERVHRNRRSYINLDKIKFEENKIISNDQELTFNLKVIGDISRDNQRTNDHRVEVFVFEFERRVRAATVRDGQVESGVVVRRLIVHIHLSLYLTQHTQK